MPEIPSEIFREEYPQPEGIFVLPADLPRDAKIRVYDRGGNLIEEKLPTEIYGSASLPPEQRLKMLDEYRERFSGISGFEPEVLQIHEETSEETHSQTSA